MGSGGGWGPPRDPRAPAGASVNRGAGLAAHSPPPCLRLPLRVLGREGGAWHGAKLLLWGSVLGVLGARGGRGTVLLGLSGPEGSSADPCPPRVALPGGLPRGVLAEGSPGGARGAETGGVKKENGHSRAFGTSPTSARHPSRRAFRPFKPPEAGRGARRAVWSVRHHEPQIFFFSSGSQEEVSSSSRSPRTGRGGAGAGPSPPPRGSIPPEADPRRGGRAGRRS